MLSEIARLHIELAESLGQRFESGDDDMDHCSEGIFTRRLNVALRDPRRGAAGDAVVAVPHVLVDNQVHRAGFVFERDERDAFGSAGALAQQHEAETQTEAVTARVQHPARRQRV